MNAASLYFFTAVNDYLDSLGFPDLAWQEWVEIRGMWQAGQKVQAIKLLRSFATKDVQYSIAPVTHPTHPFSEMMVARANRTVREPLSLLDSKVMLDWLAQEYCLDPK